MAALVQPFRPRLSLDEDSMLTIDLLERELRRRGYAPGAHFHKSEPFVGVIEGGGRRIAGRFFPSRNAILVLRTDDPEITAATINHEKAHALNYQTRCGGTATLRRSKCGYRGQHDAAFYRTLEAIHKRTGISPAAARRVEGFYKYPRRWHADHWAA